MYDYGSCIFVFQIFIAEFVFLYSYPKRKHFVWRVLAGMAIIIALAGFYPMPSWAYRSQIYMFFKYILLFVITVAYLAFCFKVRPIALISACVSGYALQHFSYQIMKLVALTPLLEGAGLDSSAREHLLELMIFPVTYLLALLSFGRLAAKHEFYKNYDIRLILVSIFTIFICLVINRFARQSASGDNAQAAVIANSLYAASCCLLSLFISYNLHALSISKAQNETLERIGYEERRQYESSKKNREQLNVKYHDLKHVLSLLDGKGNTEELRQYRKILEEYDSEIHTGNETLDIIVNEKADVCRTEGISLTFLGDGKLLSFVSQYDIYSLFGNILDNAIEAVQKIGDAQKKIISVTIESQGDYIAVNAINYFVGGLRFSDGLPATTKTTNVESHGYGTRSISLIAEKYGGEVRFSAQDDVFDLTVFLMRNHVARA